LSTLQDAAVPTVDVYASVGQRDRQIVLRIPDQERSTR
jgi:hypothetical protein